MSMKANELMIGDWVKHSITGKIGKVYRICDNEYIAFIDGDTRSELVEPIPLTPEILEKNGFNLEEAVEDYYFLYIGIDERVSLCNGEEFIDSDNKWDVCIDNEDHCTIATYELTYVHELQHILRLCKIDEEIVV